MVQDPYLESVDAARDGLFVTCLVDAMRPAIGFAAITLLEAAGCRVEVPLQQTCCGQPALKSGDLAGTRQLAQRTIALLEPFQYAVVPSGSCAATIRNHYPELFQDNPAWRARKRWQRGPMSCSASSWTFVDGHPRKWPCGPARPITTVAPGCVSLGSRLSRASCSQASRACRCARSKATRAAAASVAPSA